MIKISKEQNFWQKWVAANPIALMSLILFICLCIAIFSGAISVTMEDWVNLFDRSRSDALLGSTWVLWNLRLPRVIFAALAGAALGLTGALAQGLFRNPLADPGLLGVTSGAACTVALAIVFFSSLGIPTGVWFDLLLPGAAFLGALGVCFLIDRVSRWVTMDSIAGLLLTGIAFNSLAGAIIGLCTYLANDEQLRNLSFWMLGSLSGANWNLVGTLFILLLLSMIGMKKLAGNLNAFTLGSDVASHIGVNVVKVRMQVILLIAILSGFVVSFTGSIGFVGLVAPHMVRIIWGADQKKLIPISMLVGAVILLIADTVARTIALPAEMPIGIFTALLGAPFFLLLLGRLKNKR